MYTFASWMKEVDEHVSAISGLGVNDLSDYPFSDAFNDERDALEVAEELLEENDFPF
jgi:hypothetical protein